MKLFSIFLSLQLKATIATKGWVQVYSQTRASNDFSYCSLSSCNIRSQFNGHNNYINFDKVKGLSEYRMKFDWDGRTLEWTQQSNPLDPNIKNLNANVCANNGCKTSSGVGTRFFTGLSLSTYDAATLMDGSSGGSWWYAVGFKKYHNGGAPAFRNTNEDYIAKHVQLFVWADTEPEYYVTKVNCWKYCKDNAEGKCDFCSVGGYCCREDGVANSCPQDIMNKVNFPSSNSHMCVSVKGGNIRPPPPAQITPSFGWDAPDRNNDCWIDCNHSGGSCYSKHCGEKGFCCNKDRKGLLNSDCPTEAIDYLASWSDYSPLIAEGGHVCVKPLDEPEYYTIDVDCWSRCKANADYQIIGKCDWCREGGFCCRKDGHENTCPPDILNKVQFPSSSRHMCVTAKGAPPPTAAPDTNVFDEGSCYKDSPNRIFPKTISQRHPQMTHEFCRDSCAGYTYYGLEAGRDCYCSSQLPDGNLLVPKIDCNEKCTGNANELCGGMNYRLAVYTVPSSYEASDSETNCWFGCGWKGGSCPGFCGTNAFCCNNDPKGGLNGNCPSEAIAYLASLGDNSPFVSGGGHTCVIATHEKTKCVWEQQPKAYLSGYAEIDGSSVKNKFTTVDLAKAECINIDNKNSRSVCKGFTKGPDGLYTLRKGYAWISSPFDWEDSWRHHDCKASQTSTTDDLGNFGEDVRADFVAQLAALLEQRSAKDSSRDEQILKAKEELRKGLENSVQLEKIQFLRFVNDFNEAVFRIIFKRGGNTIEQLNEKVKNAVQKVIDESANLEGKIENISTEFVLETKENVSESVESKEDPIAELENLSDRFVKTTTTLFEAEIPEFSKVLNQPMSKITKRMSKFYTKFSCGGKQKSRRSSRETTSPCEKLTEMVDDVIAWNSQHTVKCKNEKLMKKNSKAFGKQLQKIKSRLNKKCERKLTKITKA